MSDIVGNTSNQLLKHLIIQFAFFLNFTQAIQAQVYDPIFKAVEMQATVAPLGEMVVGNFFGHKSIAAISKSGKAIYFFVADSMENLILTNVVSLPDTPIAIAKGREIVIDSSDHEGRLAKLAVLMKPRYVALISFGKEGEPIVSPEIKTEPYCTAVRTADLEVSGKLDMVTFGKFSLGVSNAKNIGGGKFSEGQTMRGALGSTPFSDIAFADFNGDLVPDIAALDWVNRRLLIFYGRGDGTFAQPVSFPLRAEPSTLSVADLNGNGYPDIAVGYARLDKIDIFGGDGLGRFFLRQTLKSVGPISKFAIADFTGDGTTDIAALSNDTKEITMFSYGPLTRNFRYAGAIGIGSEYENIVPFYFSNRLKADLVASSPHEKFIKVFKSTVNFYKSPDILVPVCSEPGFLAVSGNDSSNYMIVGNPSGRLTVRYSDGTTSMSIRSAIDWQSQGTPSSFNLIADRPPYFMLSYSNADFISLYKILGKGKGVDELTAGTPFLPFALNGEVKGDSAVIAAAYRIQSDSSIGISFFNTIRGKDEFIEQDYSVPESKTYLASALAINPSPSFFRLWRIAEDTLELACTNLQKNTSAMAYVYGSDAAFINNSISGFPILLLKGNDTLSVFGTSFTEPKKVDLHLIYSLPFVGSDFHSVRLATMDSTYYVAFFNQADNAVFLYTINGDHLRYVKSWHVAHEPKDIAISPFMNRIYFLNQLEAYASIHTF